MTYPETVSYLFSNLPMYHRIGPAAYKPDLRNTFALCSHLGNPQERFPSIHIAGTNGKGSVSHMLASILQEKGLKTGLFTSPHLKDFRERIRINGMMIPKRYVSRFVEKHKAEFDRIGLSFFEMTAGLAFDHFGREKVDIAVIETGMGGRLDSTNIITPLLSVITNISFDHMQFLGDTLEKIAREKAGIIKPGIPVVIGETQPETEKVFREKAGEKGSAIGFADASYKMIPRHPGSGPPDRMLLKAYRNDSPFISSINSPLAGLYQLKNISTLLESCEVLNGMGFRLTKPMIRKGIENTVKNTGLTGRWQIIGRSPLTICDAGHNEAGLKEVLQQSLTVPHDRLHMVIGFVNDKEIGKLLELLPDDAVYYFCKADIPRGMDQEELRKMAEITGLTGSSYPSVRKALQAARGQAAINDLVLVTGSTFVVAEVV